MDLAEVDLRFARHRIGYGDGMFSAHGSVVYRPSSDADIAAHELHHFWLHASTPYGRVLDELFRLQSHYSLLYCKYLSEFREVIPTPAYELAREVVHNEIGQPNDLLSAVEYIVKPWSQMTLLEEVLEGFDVDAISTTSLSSVAETLFEFELAASQPQTDNWYAAMQLLELDPESAGRAAHLVEDLGSEVRTCPRLPVVVTPGGRDAAFGAFHLFESCAQRMELPDPTVESLLLSPEGLPYLVPFAQVAQKFGRLRFKDEDSVRRVTTTFLTIADLALYVPCGATYRSLRPESATWLDIHPGHRFNRLLEVLEEEDWIGAYDEHAPALQLRLSERLGWARPDAFLEVGAGLRDDSAHGSRHAAACRQRLEWPNRGIMGPDGTTAEQLAEFLVEFGPMQVIDSSRCIVPGITGAEKLGRLIGYAMGQLNWMVMVNGVTSLERLAPPGIAENASIAFESAGDFVEVLRSQLPFIEQLGII